MRKGQIEVTQNCERETRSTAMEFHGVGTNMVTFIPIAMEDGIRLHLVAAHKERKANKADHRFYAKAHSYPGIWVVCDRDDDHQVHARFVYSPCSESDARAFAKLLNKRNRKPMGGEA